MKYVKYRFKDRWSAILIGTLEKLSVIDYYDIGITYGGSIMQKTYTITIRKGEQHDTK